jgi:hypothetical protein
LATKWGKGRHVFSRWRPNQKETKKLFLRYSQTKLVSQQSFWRYDISAVRTLRVSSLWSCLSWCRVPIAWLHQTSISIICDPHILRHLAPSVTPNTRLTVSSNMQVRRARRHDFGLPLSRA